MTSFSAVLSYMYAHHLFHSEFVVLIYGIMVHAVTINDYIIVQQGDKAKVVMSSHFK